MIELMHRARLLTTILRPGLFVLGALGASLALTLVAACREEDETPASVADAGPDTPPIVIPSADSHVEIDPTTFRPLLASGGQHSCVILEDQSVRCWGLNAFGQLGFPEAVPDGENPPIFDGTPSGYPQRALVGTAASLSVGGFEGIIATASSCAVMPNKEVRCWGNDSAGALGRGAATMDPKVSQYPHPEALPVSGLPPSDQVVTNGMYSCALSNVRLTCWGNNLKEYPWFPIDQDMKLHARGIALPEGRTAKQVAISQFHICALLDNGTVACWGANQSGETGTSITLPDATPRIVPRLEGVAEISLEQGLTCARTQAGSVLCFGDNTNGRLGRGPLDAGQDGTPEPVALPPGKSAKQISVGPQHACAILEDRSIWCWGSNMYGALGSGKSDGTNIEPPESSTPVMVQGLPAGAVSVSTGNDFTCAVLLDQSVRCWGTNRYGQLGRGNYYDDAKYLKPEPVKF